MKSEQEELSRYRQLINLRYSDAYYRFRRRFWSLGGFLVDIVDKSGIPVLHVFEEPFKSSWELLIHSHPATKNALLKISQTVLAVARETFEVRDLMDNAIIGSYRRGVMSEDIRECWEIFDCNQQLIGRIREDSLRQSLMRRFFVGIFRPAAFIITDAGENHVATARRQFNLLLTIMDLAISQDVQTTAIDPRLLICATSMLVLLDERRYNRYHLSLFDS